MLIIHPTDDGAMSFMAQTIMPLIWVTFVLMDVLLVISQTQCPANTIQDYCYLVDLTPLSPCTAHETCAIRAHQIGWRGQLMGEQYAVLNEIPDGIYYTNLNKQMGDAIGWKFIFNSSSETHIQSNDLDAFGISFGYAMVKVDQGRINFVAAEVGKPMEAIAICILSPSMQETVSKFKASSNVILTADAKFFSCKKAFENVLTRIECAMRCQKTENCISFYYKLESQRCVIQLYVDAMLQSDDFAYKWSHMKKVN